MSLVYFRKNIEQGGRRVTAAKYAEMVKPLKYRKGMGGANARELVFVGGDELGGFDFNFIVGVYDTPGDWAPNRGAHEHPFDEILLFFGYDPTDMNYLGSEMSLALGPEYEEHRFNGPMAVPAPQGMPHCPLVTEKVFKPFGHFHLALNAKYAGSSIARAGATDGHKYDSYMHKMTAIGGPGAADAQQMFKMSGADLNGLNLNFVMGLYNQPGRWIQASHQHPYNEVMVFFGHNVNDLSYLGAEISIEIGPQHEKFNFNVPTAVAIPAGVPHFPVMVNKVEQPYRMMQIGLNSQYQSR
jgi:hypothetical protein